MGINDFSALIGMVATMSIAFVATEYVTSYTRNLCERFFKFQEYIKENFDKCRNILTDKESLKLLHPVDINGKSTNSKIEDVKRKNESINKEIDELEKRKISEVVEMCQARSMSSLCLFIFMFNTGLLLLGSIEPKLGESTLKYLSILCVLSILYIFLGWGLGEFECKNNLLRFSSLRHATYSFVVIVLLSFGLHSLGLSIIEDLSSAWWGILLTAIILSYFNFIVFILKIKWKARTFKIDLENSRNEIEQSCKEVEKETQDLMTVSRMGDLLDTTPFETLN